MFVIAWGLFVVSFFLQGIEHMRGWECAQFSVGALTALFRGDFERGWGFYHAAFTLENALMLISPIAIFRRNSTRRFSKVVMTLSSIAALHVISFAILARGEGLRIGYVLWAASFIIFALEWMRVGFLSRTPKVAG